MKPYYEDESVTLFHASCIESDEHSWTHSWRAADALVSDVPYGIEYRSNARRQSLPRSIEGDLDTGARDEALWIWDPTGTRPALVFGTWRIQRPLSTRQVLIWDTKGALGMGAVDLPWKPGHQEIYVIGKGFSGHRGNDVLRCAPVQSLGYNGRVHPHQKPIDLMGELIRKCPPGVITDPFAGSGSTLVAAKREGRRAIGVELDERYCEVAAKRLQNVDVTLFGGAA